MKNKKEILKKHTGKGGKLITETGIPQVAKVTRQQSPSMTERSPWDEIKGGASSVARGIGRGASELGKGIMGGAIGGAGKAAAELVRKNKVGLVRPGIRKGMSTQKSEIPMPQLKVQDDTLKKNILKKYTGSEGLKVQKD